MVVIDNEDYTNNAHWLLSDTSMYKPIPRDPSNKLKNKLAQTLRDIKTQGRLSYTKYKRLYTTSTVAPMFYALPKLHKSGISQGSLSLVGVHHTWGG